MGKNHGKRGQRTELAKMESIMRKLDNSLKAKAATRKKKDKRGKKNA